jgi:hypothetical protein
MWERETYTEIVNRIKLHTVILQLTLTRLIVFYVQTPGFILFYT